MQHPHICRGRLSKAGAGFGCYNIFRFTEASYRQPNPQTAQYHLIHPWHPRLASSNSPNKAQNPLQTVPITLPPIPLYPSINLTPSSIPLNFPPYPTNPDFPATTSLKLTQPPFTNPASLPSTNRFHPPRTRHASTAPRLPLFQVSNLVFQNPEPSNIPRRSHSPLASHP